MENSSDIIKETTVAAKSGEIEIDLLELSRKLWDKRKFILKVTAIFAGLGLFVAIFSPKEYTSSVTMVPQVTDNKSKAGGLAAMAAMAGFNLGDMGNSDVLSPTIYPKIMESVKFKKDLMYTKVKFDNIPQEITLYEYYTNDDYQPFNMLGTIRKYTLGLPGVIIKAIKGEESPVTHRSLPYLQLTPKEVRVVNLISSKVSLVIDEKGGTLNLTANMPEALASTQVVEAARLLLQKYITDFKVDKVRQNLDFIQQRYNEAKHSFEQKQMQLASFSDANRNVVLASALTTRDRINAEYNLLYSVYSELAKQLEQAKIKVKDATPVLTVIEPAVVPNKKSKPNKFLILFLFVFIGGLFSAGLILKNDFVDSLKNRKIR